MWAVSLSLSGAKMSKITDRDQNLIRSESGQDWSLCQILGHYSRAFSTECLETPDMISFT